MIDLTLKSDFSKLKSGGIASAILEYSDFVGVEPVAVFRVPDKCLITNTSIFSEIAGNCLLSVTCGKVTTLADANMADRYSIFKSDISVATKSGVTVSATPNIVPTHGEFVLIVEYVQYTCTTGFLSGYR